MKEELLTFIEELKKNEQKILFYDEQKTKQGIILKFLAILGWDVFNPEEVCPEYTVSGKRVDYALQIGNSKVFIEVKKVEKDLESSEYQKQLLNYSFHEGIELAVLTNGINWYFYLPLQEGNWEQRKFYTINIFEQNVSEVSLKFIDFLSQENIINGNATKNARKVIAGKQKQRALDETLPKAWNKLVVEQDELLVELISETTEKICGYEANEKQIKNFLLVHKSDLELPVNNTSFSLKKPKKILSKVKLPDVRLKFQNGEVQLNSQTFKIEKQNAKALVDGFEKNSKCYYSSIYTAHEKARSLQKNFREIPKLLTVFKGNPRPEYPLSGIGKNPYTKGYELKGKYIAILDRIFHIKNNMEIWNCLCSEGIFDIWEPEAPYNSLDGKNKPMILLLRIFEIDYDLTDEIDDKGSRYFDTIPEGKMVKIVKPIIPNNKSNNFGYDGVYSFKDIVKKIEKATEQYLKNEEIIYDTLEMKL